MRLKTISLLISICTLVTYFFSNAFPVYAGGGILSNVFDNIQLDDQGVTVEHQITLTQPFGTVINASDYITIQMPGYNPAGINIDNIFISGSFVYGDMTGLHASLSGTTITLTNISVISGATIQINGMKAANPPPGDFGETLIVSTDPQLQNIIEEASFTPSVSPSGIVSASATIEPNVAEIDLSGFAYPNSFITITDNGTVIATTSPNGLEHFPLTCLVLPQEKQPYHCMQLMRIATQQQQPPSLSMHLPMLPQTIATSFSPLSSQSTRTRFNKETIL